MVGFLAAFLALPSWAMGVIVSLLALFVVVLLTVLFPGVGIFFWIAGLAVVGLMTKDIRFVETQSVSLTVGTALLVVALMLFIISMIGLDQQVFVGSIVGAPATPASTIFGFDVPDQQFSLIDVFTVVGSTTTVIVALNATGHLTFKKKRKRR